MRNVFKFFADALASSLLLFAAFCLIAFGYALIMGPTGFIQAHLATHAGFLAFFPSNMTGKDIGEIFVLCMGLYFCLIFLIGGCLLTIKTEQYDWIEDDQGNKVIEFEASEWHWRWDPVFRKGRLCSA